jgi:hypothetical protein
MPWSWMWLNSSTAAPDTCGYKTRVQAGQKTR